MNEIFPPELPRPIQKAQRIKRLFEIEDRMHNQLGLTTYDSKVRQVALDKYRSERRSEEQNKRRRYDKDFDILNRNAFDEDLDKIFGELFPTPESFQEEEGIFKKLHIIRFDMKMLNYFNSLSSGDAAGDNYKRAVARIISAKSPEINEWLKAERIEYRGYLIGGDEFAVIAVGDNEQVGKLAQKLQMETANIKKPEDSLVSPHIDFGIANLAEVIGEFRQIEASQITQISVQNIVGERIKLRKLLNGLADRKSKINKFLERIKFLVEESKTQPTRIFLKLHASATKSAEMISLAISLLDSLGTSERAAKDWISTYYQEKDENTMKQIDDPFQKTAISFYLRKTKEYLNA